jgi:ATP/maltotriose-dependent transcriptional regulator MalT
MTKTKNTVTDFKAELEAAGIKLAPLCGHISSLEAGSMQSVKASTGVLALTYAVMWGAGIRPSDYITPKSKGSTATTEQWADRYTVASMLCYSPAELAELDAPMAKDATLEQKAARKALQERKKDLMRTIKRGLTTQDKLHNPEAYEGDGANERKTSLEKLAIAFGTIEKIAQGEGLPEWFDVPEFCAIIAATRKKFKIPAATKSVDDYI